MGAPVVHFEVHGNDLERTKEFYGSLFSWDIQDVMSMPYSLVDSGVKMGINGGLAQVEPGTNPFVTFYVQVEDPQSHLEKAVRLGGKIIMPVTEIPGTVALALFSDPDGCIVGLIKGPETDRKTNPLRKKKIARRKPQTTARRKTKSKK